MNTIVPISADALDAMRTLVVAGVSDEAIGRALRELLIGGDLERQALRRVPGWSESAAFGARPATGVPTVIPEDIPTQSGPATGSPLAGMVPLKVRFATGKPSNVSIPAHLLHQVSLTLGSEEAARQQVRDLAKEIAEGASNRSGLIQAALAKLVSA